MKYTFPVKDVLLNETDVVPAVVNPVASGDMWEVSGNEFSLRAIGVGNFYVSDGREVKFTVFPGADPEWVQLYLNGQVLVALLHQRKIINFHASSFIYNNRGIMILGETGAGKSTLTLSFVLRGAGFLTDDLNPVVFRDNGPSIMPLRRRIKIRKGTAEELGIDRGRLTEAERGTGKEYLTLIPESVDDYPLHTIMRIEPGNVLQPEFSILSHAERFSMLRSEVCSWELLAGMPETEKAYLEQLVRIVEEVEIVRVIRPAEIRIADFHGAVKEYLDMVKG
jgi:hypothetical protein